MIKNPLELFGQKYTIKFKTHSGKLITIGPTSIEEIIMDLKEKSLLFLPAKATEGLSIIISAFERNGQMLVKEDMNTSRFYFIDKKIRNYNNSHPKPTLDQIRKCCEILDVLQSKFKKKDIFPTLLKWSIVAPFDYILKQVHKKWIPWLYLYGWSNTGKTTLGEVSCCIWNRYHEKDAILPFTGVDTKARFGGIDLIKKIKEKDTDYKIKTIIISTFIKDNLPYDKSYVTLIDKILEKPVYLDRLKNEIQELISTIDIQQKTE
jgi:hypothetical protein